MKKEEEHKEISTREQLIDSLEDVRAVEILARDHYIKDTLTFNNIEIVDTIESIKVDEDKHIALLDDLLKTLKKENTNL